MIVGDPNQSIYGFKYAHPEGITRYHETHENTADESLGDCRRCPKRVVRVANSLIRQNRSADASLELSPDPEKGEGEVHVVQWRNQEDEAQGLSAYVEYLVRDQAVREQDILILCPRRHMGCRIRDLIRARDITVHSFYHEEALEGVEAQRSLVLLTLLAQPKDRVALRWWLGAGSPSHRAGAYARLRAYCEESGDDPSDALERIERQEVRIPYTAPLVTRYRELQDRLRELSESSMDRLVEALFPEGETGLGPMRGIAIRGMAEADSASDLFDYITAQIRRPGIPPGPFVRVMSLHKSKGLTSRVVIVSGCSEGLIPSESLGSDVQSAAEQLEEQRRLFYVAVTRTTERLVLSSFTRIPYGDALRSSIKVQRAGRGGENRGKQVHTRTR